MEIWSFGEYGQAGQDLVGFDVEAANGSLGRVERQVDDAGRQHLVVDTGVWLFGRSVLVPAGAVTAVDPGERTVRIAFTKEEIKGAPRFTTDQDTADPAYLGAVGSYYLHLSRAGHDAVC